MQIDSCESTSVEQHLCKDCWDSASKTNNLEADLKTLKQKGYLISSPVFVISPIPRNLSRPEIPNDPLTM